MQRGWSKEEVELIVDDYFSMLGSELRGEPYNKTEHRQALKLQLGKRSDSSIERKHQNISAVVIELGLPYIDGYKPLRNYQRALLPEAVHSYLGAHRETVELLEMDADASPAVPTIDDILRVLDTAPQAREHVKYDEVHERPKPPYGAFDYLRREAVNRRLGLAGEQFVVNFERRG